MQQHTGQHVLSAAFDRLFGVRTESFHLGQLSRRPSISRARSRRPRLRRPRTRPIASSGRIGRSRSGLRPRKKRRRCRCARNPRAPARCGSSTCRTTTCRPAAARTSPAPARSASSPSAAGRSFEAASRVEFLCGEPCPAALPPVARCAGGDAETPVGAAGRDGGGARAAARRREGAAADDPRLPGKTGAHEARACSRRAPP